MNKNVILVLLLGLSCNLDNIAIGISYGVRSIRLPWRSNLLIAFLTGFGTWLFIVFGQRIITYISPKAAVLAASGILIGMGLWVLWQEYRNYSQETEAEAGEQPVAVQRENKAAPRSLWQQMTHILKDPSFADKDSSGHIDLRESLLLSLALMLNNIPNGLGAGLLGLPALFTAAVVALLSIVTFLIGIGSGKSLGRRWLGQWAGTAAGVLLIVVGIVEIFLE
jgi:putative sporulation protein YtaF